MTLYDCSANSIKPRVIYEIYFKMAQKCFLHGFEAFEEMEWLKKVLGMGFLARRNLFHKQYVKFYVPPIMLFHWRRTHFAVFGAKPYKKYRENDILLVFEIQDKIWNMFEFAFVFDFCSNEQIQNVLKERVRVLIFYIVKHYNIFYTIHNPLTPKIFLKFFRISKFSCCKWISMTHPWVAGKISYTRILGWFFNLYSFFFSGTLCFIRGISRTEKPLKKCFILWSPRYE